MTLIGPVVAQTLPLMREHAESLMVDTITVERQTGTTLDPDTLAEVPTYTTVYTGSGRVVRPGSLSPRDDVAGGFEFGVSALLAYLPVSADDAEPGDRLTVTAIGSLTDPGLAGVVATVQADLTRTYAAKRTLVCEEVS